MKAKFIFKDGINAKSHRRENNFMEQYTGFVLIDGELREIVTLRIYGTNAKNYACLWYNNIAEWASGSGSAGGYGYHRPSAAAQEAFDTAGVTLSECISGRGDSAIREAVEALAKAMFPRKKIFIHKSHA